MVKLLFFLFLTPFLYANTFKVTSYNVENLFDLSYDKTEYKEYIPNTKSQWNKKTFDVKLNNLIKVIKEIDADIVALQEIENKNLIKLLKRRIPQYKYTSFEKYKNSSVGLAVLSKIEIKSSKRISVRFTNKTFRPIQEVTLQFNNNEFKIFNNHWPSKRSSESYRIKYAKALYDRVKSLPDDYDYILLGDFNSNYNEYKTIRYDKKLNDTYSITGINQILNTTIDESFVTLSNISKLKKRVHYNLWLDLDYQNRFSTIYKGHNNTPDSILIPYSLFDNKKISYKLNSFLVFKPSYLYENKKINRWQVRNGIHKAEGYSDHLPIVASFSTTKLFKNSLKDISSEHIENIAQLYNKENIQEEILIKNAIVIYKSGNNAIVKQKNNRAIYFYNNAQSLSEGFSYDILVKGIGDFFGLKEIKKFEIKNHNGKVENYNQLYIDAKKINLYDLRYQNEIITNLIGIYKGRKFYFDDRKINIYFRNKDDIPKENSTIYIKKAQLGYYKSNIQLIIHNKSDIDVN